MIDTERGSASQPADLITFDVVELDSFYPQRYIEAIHEAEAGGYGVLIIDSLSPGSAKMAPESWSIRRPNAWPHDTAVAAKIPSPLGWLIQRDHRRASGDHVGMSVQPHAPAVSPSSA